MSNNLNLSQLTTGQSQKEVTINEATGQLDAALTETLTLDLSSADAVLTDTQFRRNLMFRAEGMTVARSVSVPAIKKMFVVHSAASNTAPLAVICGATSITVPPGKTDVFVTDGTPDGMVSLFHAGSEENRGFSFAAFIPGSPSAGALCLQTVMADNVVFGEDFAGSYAISAVPAGADAVFDILKNGASIGTLTFSFGLDTGVFDSAEVSFAKGDILYVLAPDPADADLRDISFTLKGSCV